MQTKYLKQTIPYYGSQIHVRQLESDEKPKNGDFYWTGIFWNKIFDDSIQAFKQGTEFYRELTDIMEYRGQNYYKLSSTDRFKKGDIGNYEIYLGWKILPIHCEMFGSLIGKRGTLVADMADYYRPLEKPQDLAVKNENDIISGVDAIKTTSLKKEGLKVGSFTVSSFNNEFTIGEQYKIPVEGERYDNVNYPWMGGIIDLVNDEKKYFIYICDNGNIFPLVYTFEHLYTFHKNHKLKWVKVGEIYTHIHWGSIKIISVKNDYFDCYNSYWKYCRRVKKEESANFFKSWTLKV